MHSVLPRSAARPATRVPLAWALLLAVLTAAALAMVPTRAEAYPDPQCTCTISSQHVKSGQKIVFVGEAGEPLHWKVIFRGDTRTSTGTRFRTVFVAPRVDKPTVYQLKVEAAFVDQPGRSVTVSGVCKRTFDITVSPKGAPRDGDGETSGPTDNDGLLPNTGGPQLALLGLALLLLLAGATSIRRARRVSDEV